MRCMLNEGECDEVGNLIKRKFLIWQHSRDSTGSMK
jgi:hypothetical protein